MPAGKPWLKVKPKTFPMPMRDYWHVFREPYGALASNPASEARFALTRKLGMFYVAESLAAALWETLLRGIEPDSNGRVSIEADQLRGYRAAKLTLVKDDVHCLHFNTPRAKHLFPTDSAEMRDLKRLVSSSDHARSRTEAERLYQELLAMSILDMPTLCWQSNQCSSSQAFLLYEPPMKQSWWIASDPIKMDTSVGYQALEEELRAHGFLWAPGDAF